ncbi:MAG: phosphopyruvate hydratase [Acidobacteria bacterium]|nr:MAG: phosphopyruvate hydratase [Acidobacteriota bacterium]
MARIAAIRAREVLDSRGNPTVEAEVFLNDGARGRAIVPSGASTGKHEALELRDEDPRRFHGRGVRTAVENVEMAIAPALAGWEARDQAGLDSRLVALDGTREKRRLGANALLGVSMAVARAAAASAGLPLYRYLGGAGDAELPVPLVNILSGGLHGGGNFDFQDFMVVPLAARSFRQSLEHAAAVHAAMKDVLKARGVHRAGVADEGGYAPQLEGNEAGFELMTEAIERAGLKPGAEVAIAVDVAASHLLRRGDYHLEADHARLGAEEMIERLAGWAGRYPVVSIEDGLGEDDWAGWKLLTKRLGGRTQLIGDDLFVTRLERLAQGLESAVANAILVKPNQVGTLTEALEVVEFAQENGYNAVVSARSGETEDSFIADLAVATGAGQIKIGALTRSERLAKYNRLLQIERELGPSARYRGGEVFRAGLVPPSGAG